MKVNWNIALNAITACAAVVIAITGLFALRFAERRVQQFQQAAQVQKLEGRINDYESARFVDIRKSLANQRIDLSEKRLRKYDPENPPDPLIDELNFCDDLGLLVYRGVLNRHDVWDVFSNWLFVLDTDAQPAIDAARKQGISNFGDCTDLVESLHDIEVAENASARRMQPSDDDIYRFYLAETNAQPGESPGQSRTHRIVTQSSGQPQH